MAGEMEQLFSVVGRVYVMLRRETNRMVDVEWAIANAEYASEVIKRVEVILPTVLFDAPKYVQSLR